MTVSDLAELEAEISRQFGLLCFPAHGRLLYDEECLHDECVYIKTVFARKNWWEVSPPEGMSFRNDLFSFFSEEALNYYFPVFMLEISRSYDAADVLVDRFLELILDGVAGGNDGPIKLTGNKGLVFTFGQHLAVINFLRFIVYNYDDEDALHILVKLGCK